MVSKIVRLFVGSVLAVTMLATSAQSTHPIADVSIELLFKVDGREVALADGLRNALIAQADKILRHCSYDAGDRDEPVWHEALAEPSQIRLIYATPVPLKLLRREVLVSEAVFSLADPDFLGSPVLHHAGRTTLVFKCHGGDMLRLMCMPELKPHFPPGYQRNCHIVRGD